jgi:hypothetical protein
MTIAPHARLLRQEARALLTRLALVKPFVLQETMVPAAALPPAAQAGIEALIAQSRRELDGRVRAFLAWLDCPSGQAASPEAAQRRFVFLRMRFNTILEKIDIFADVLTQRSEHETGVWLAGLDAVAADALTLPGDYYRRPPVVCYVDRGHGAAIRRARTRLPGGPENPVAIIRVPRERMVGAGIASSLVHEVGHQADALLGLVASLRPSLAALTRARGPQALAWRLFDRWLGEIVADLWAVARVGVGAPIGLIGVVSLPRVFVFRIGLDEPHPFPWIRVRIALAFGQGLWPDPQWERIGRIWSSFYPRRGLDPGGARLLELIETTLPAFVGLALAHRPPRLRGKTIAEALRTGERTPAALRARLRAWRADPAAAARTPPSLAFAVLGQARADDALAPEDEGALTARLLTAWAVGRALGQGPVLHLPAPAEPAPPQATLPH